MDQKKLSVTEQNIINRMKSSKNKDGFYEMILSDKVKERNFSIKSLTNQFEDKAFCTLLEKLYAESKTKASFKKKILMLVQMSLKEKLLSGKVTYKFIQETADLADTYWLKVEAFKDNASAKTKVAYFFKRFQEEFLFIDGMSSKKSRAELLMEYTSKTKYFSKYLAELFVENRKPLGDDMHVALIFNAVRKSF